MELSRPIYFPGETVAPETVDGQPTSQEAIQFRQELEAIESLTRNTGNDDAIILDSTSFQSWNLRAKIKKWNVL